MAFKHAGNDTTEHDLITINLACILFLTLSVYQKKWKISALLLFKSKLLWKLSFDDKSFTKLWCESEKDSRGMVLGSHSTSQTHGLTSDFKACLPYENAMYEWNNTFGKRFSYFFEDCSNRFLKQ